MEKNVTLKDGSVVVIRDMRADDLERSYTFFSELPPDDRKYLRLDVTSWEVVEVRVRELDPDRVCRLVAEQDGAIVGDGALELQGHGWGEGVAEIRLIVARPFQRLGLGSYLARELVFLAAEHRVSRIMARMVRQQEGAHGMLRKLGFREEFLIPAQARDREGKWQDLIIMRCNLEELWRRMEDASMGGDWQRHR
jgi:ribosomal protein S18 acetylase RimI-like enzyme